MQDLDYKLNTHLNKQVQALKQKHNIELIKLYTMHEEIREAVKCNPQIYADFFNAIKWTPERGFFFLVSVIFVPTQ